MYGGQLLTAALMHCQAGLFLGQSPQMIQWYHNLTIVRGEPQTIPSEIQTESAVSFDLRLHLLQVGSWISPLGEYW